MPRTPRIAPGGMIFHVLNRANARARIFARPSDYVGFQLVLARAVVQYDMRLLSYCIMPNHWHLVLWPRDDGDLARFMHGLTTRHVRRWHRSHDSDGLGHLYQGCYRSFPVQNDQHLLIVCRYVERNAASAGLVERAQDWPWSSAHSFAQAGLGKNGAPTPALATWPVSRPLDWLAFLNQPATAKELAAVRLAARRGTPFGGKRWRQRTATELGLASTLRPHGRAPLVRASATLR